MKNSELTEVVKKVINDLDTDANIFLFGSRVSENYTPDSDWDFLVITPSEVNIDYKKKMLNAIYQVELRYNTIINTIIVNEAEWNKSLNKITPFYESIAAQSHRL